MDKRNIEPERARSQRERSRSPMDRGQEKEGTAVAAETPGGTLAKKPQQLPKDVEMAEVPQEDRRPDPPVVRVEETVQKDTFAQAVVSAPAPAPALAPALAPAPAPAKPAPAPKALALPPEAAHPKGAQVPPPPPPRPKDSQPKPQRPAKNTGASQGKGGEPREAPKKGPVAASPEALRVLEQATVARLPAPTLPTTASSGTAQASTSGAVHTTPPPSQSGTGDANTSAAKAAEDTGNKRPGSQTVHQQVREAQQAVARRSYASAARGERATTSAASEVGVRAQDVSTAPGKESTGGGGSGRPLSAHERQRIQAELDIINNDAFLQAFFSEGGRHADRWQRFVIRLRYRGRDPDAFDRDWVIALLEEGLGLSSAEVPAIASPFGLREIDLEFDTEAQYLHFWERCRLKVLENPHLFDEVVMVPLFRGETKVVNISFRSTKIPAEDVDFWLRRHCRVLHSAQQKIDERGYKSSDYRAIVQLERAERGGGGYRHIPKFFFLGPDRGVTRYSGQPPACYTCGAWDHYRSKCVTELCSRCGTRGHRTAGCNRPVTCSLCGGLGHGYRMCPEAHLNQLYPEEFQADVFRAAEEEERRRREADKKKDQEQAYQQREQARQPTKKPTPEKGAVRQQPGEKSRGGAPPEPSTGSDPQWVFEAQGAEAAEATGTKKVAPLTIRLSEVSEGEGQSEALASGSSSEEEQEVEEIRRLRGEKPWKRLNSRQRRKKRREFVRANKQAAAGAAGKTAGEVRDQDQVESMEVIVTPVLSQPQTTRRTPAPCPRKEATDSEGQVAPEEEEAVPAANRGKGAKGGKTPKKPTPPKTQKQQLEKSQGGECSK